MDIMSQLTEPAFWQAFLQHKKEKQHMSDKEESSYREILESRAFANLIEEMQQPFWSAPVPVKREINKQGAKKKRQVYTFRPEMNVALKLICFGLGQYDSLFADNCYAFRSHRSAADAVRELQQLEGLDEKYCLKADLQNYFNSIDVELLLERLGFLAQENESLLEMLAALLRKDEALVHGKVTCEKRGAMAGTPVSPFFANVYLMDLDRELHDLGVPYFRYSDDILLFADSMQELTKRQELLFQRLQERKLQINESKAALYQPGETISFLGFSFANGEVGLSEVTKMKIKGKIKRKAHALRRWGEQKKLAPEMAAKGFVKAMNHKFFAQGGRDFTWCRWFLPLLSKTEDLHEIDLYMQQYIRYTVTGRHYKGNYKISYEKLKEWGYRSLVHEYYAWKKKEQN